MKRLMVIINILALFVIGCGKPPADTASSNQTAAPTAGGAQPAEGNSGKFQPFFVYKDKGTRENHFVPSGFMPDGKCLQFNDMSQEKCYEGKTCIKIAYDVACSAQGQKWAGIYWLNPANNWGARKGGFNLNGAEKLTFWARGEKGGERIEEFKIGGITGDFPDTDMGVIGPVILTPEWRQYSIDLRGKDLSYISGGFSWATNVDVNPNNCTFFLDMIQYE
jgi:hypothetical protein